jgi:carboxypeptidase D
MRLLSGSMVSITMDRDKDLTLLGGPGCSSLEGFLQENGAFIWTWGQYNGLPNPYSWVNLTNMLWVEYPVGTGFSQGNVTASSEEDIAQDFIGFFRNFENIFGIQNYKIYITGESYAGRYVPYVASAMLDQNDTSLFNLSGILMYDPVIGKYDYVQNAVATVPFVNDHLKFFNFNQTFLDLLREAHQFCGYFDYYETFMQFPPPRTQPALDKPYNTINPKCDVWDEAHSAAFQMNPCFNSYEVSCTCPILFDPLGFPTDLVYGYAEFDGPYFNRAAVKKALHVPDDITWAECTPESVFQGTDPGQYGNYDLSADPIQHVLPRVIEATNRVLVANGDFDFVIITAGTLLSIQNMTWNGALGFQQQPADDIVIDLPDLQWGAAFAANGDAGLDGPGQGVMGVQHYERGLMWAETFQSGHMQPQFQPRVAYRHLQWLLGRIDKL